MDFLRKRNVIIWVVLIWAFTQFLLAGTGIVANMSRMFYVYGYRVIILSLLAYLFYRDYVVGKWLFAAYVLFLGIGGIYLGIMTVTAGQYTFPMLLSFVLGPYFIYSAVCIYRYY